MQPRVHVEGLRELSKAIRDLEDKELKKGLRQANLEAAKVVADGARSKVPIRSGRARASVKPSAGQKFASIRAGGNRAAYFGWLDFGGTRRPREMKPSRRKIKEGRYIYPTVRERRDEIVDVYADALTALLKRAGLL